MILQQVSYCTCCLFHLNIILVVLYQEEELRVRRVASGIAKDVKKFWLKVDKLVSYKQQLLIEERKKKALDKHLDFLLGQTERYMLHQSF